MKTGVGFPERNFSDFSGVLVNFREFLEVFRGFLEVFRAIFVGDKNWVERMKKVSKPRNIVSKESNGDCSKSLSSR